MILTGVIHTIFPTENFGNFEKRVFWLQELNVKYPSTWALEFHNDDVIELNVYKGGEVVECQISVKGKLLRKQGKEFVINTLKCEEIKRV